MPTIMISYRREDSKWITGRIFDRLESHYGRGSVYMDIDNIPVGLDFRENLQHSLQVCDILLAVVGPHWLGPEEHGHHAIEEETDWVRIEIETALAKNIPVIPVLIDRVRMPKSSELPESLRNFAFRQAAEIDSGVDFRPHMDRLIRSMDQYLESRSGTPLPVSGVVTQAPNLQLPISDDQKAIRASARLNTEVSGPGKDSARIAQGGPSVSLRSVAASWTGFGVLLASELSTFLSEQFAEAVGDLPILTAVSAPLAVMGLSLIGLGVFGRLRVQGCGVAAKRAITGFGTLSVAIVPCIFNWTNQPNQYPLTLAWPLVLLGGLGLTLIGAVFASHLVHIEGRSRHLKVWIAVSAAALGFALADWSVSHLAMIDWRVDGTLIFTCVMTSLTVIAVTVVWLFFDC
jgi:hypothetical protein